MRIPRDPRWAILTAVVAVAAIAGLLIVAGAHAAPSAAYSQRLTIAGLATDTGGQPAAQPAPPLDERVSLGNLSTTFTVGVTVFGEVTNALAVPIDTVMVHGVAYDADGDAIGTVDVQALVDEIAPGAREPFRVVFPNAVPAGARTEVTVASYRVAASPTGPDLYVRWMRRSHSRPSPTTRTRTSALPAPRIRPASSPDPSPTTAHARWARFAW
jgi:hypothetical protein